MMRGSIKKMLANFKNGRTAHANMERRLGGKEQEGDATAKTRVGLRNGRKRGLNARFPRGDSLTPQGSRENAGQSPALGP